MRWASEFGFGSGKALSHAHSRAANASLHEFELLFRANVYYFAFIAYGFNLINLHCIQAQSRQEVVDFEIRI